MDGATSLDDLMPQGPQSAGPQSAGISGADKYSQGGMAPSFRPGLPAMRFMLSNFTLYLAFFLSAALFALSTPRAMLLQYLPSAYSTGGVLSWQGAAALGGATTVLAHFINVVFQSLLG